MGLSGGDVIKLHYTIQPGDMAAAVEASSSVKKKLSQLGIDPYAIKKIGRAHV